MIVCMCGMRRTMQANGWANRQWIIRTFRPYAFDASKFVLRKWQKIIGMNEKNEKICIQNH